MRSPQTRAPRATPVVLSLLMLVLTLFCLAGSPAHADLATSRASHTSHAKAATSTVKAAAVLKLVNQARAHARSCGGVHYRAVGPLRYNAKLQNTARQFAQLMGRLDFFDHVSPSGTDPGDRITASGYRWHSYGENIAAGYTTPRAVVAGWLASPGHCANIMTPFKDVGIGYANVASSSYHLYWVMDFGTH